ncbi:hypothetical protein KQR54_18355 [Mycobacterium gordonae]|nr:hypothetical protein [Mycobacterium gordonae]
MAAATTKSNALQALLGAKLDAEVSVPIKRLGVNFRIKPLNGEALERARLECTVGDSKGGKTVNESQLNATLIAKSCIEPNFADRSLIDHYGAEDAADCVNKALLAGEIGKLNLAVLEASGFGDDGDTDFPN